MQAEKKWRERSKKKNPEKDDVYMNTQLVMKYLKGDSACPAGSSPAILVLATGRNARKYQ
ncbi:MAG TPA: hypothetical protein GX696_05475 [Pseudomonadaceae bacterium]|nr:hypothetical protein [Pseudomonadaceae bacterium]